MKHDLFISLSSGQDTAQRGMKWNAVFLPMSNALCVVHEPEGLIKTSLGLNPDSLLTYIL